MQIQIVPATPRDVDVVIDILDQAATWIIAQNHPHVWTPGGFSRETFLEQTSQGEVFLGLADGNPAGTFVLQWSDALWWGQVPPDAGYIHKLAVRPAFAGIGAGLQMLRSAEEKTRSRGEIFCGSTV